MIGEQAPLNRRRGGKVRQDALTSARDDQPRTAHMQKGARMSAAVEALVPDSDRPLLLLAAVVRINAPHAVGRADFEPWRPLSIRSVRRSRNRGSERVDQDRNGGNRDNVDPLAGEKTHRRMLLEPSAMGVHHRDSPACFTMSNFEGLPACDAVLLGSLDQGEKTRFRSSRNSAPGSRRP